MINNNVNFKGYRNTLCSYNILTGNKLTTFIATQLDDNDGFKDLSNFKQLQAIQNPYADETASDVLSYYLIKDLKTGLGYSYLNNKSLYNGDELLDFENNYNSGLITESKFNQEKKFHMKAYTLLASLTKRMKNADFDISDNGILHTAEGLYRTLSSLKLNNRLIYNSQQAFDIVSIGCFKTIKLKVLAEAINIGISGTMEHFFKRI